MKGKKIIIISIIINILTIGIIYNLIKKDYLNNEKIVIKAMTEGEYEDYITSLNQSHIDYANYIQESKTKIASAITDMGVTTSNEATLETMSSNIRSIARDASSISYDNSSSTLTSTNVQGAVDELNESLSPNIIYSDNGIVIKKYGKLLIIDFNNATMSNGGTMPIPEEYTVANIAVATLRNVTDNGVATLVVNTGKICNIGDLNGHVLTNKVFYGQIIILIN